MARPKRSRTITGFPEYNMFVPDGIPQRGYIELELDEFEEVLSLLLLLKVLNLMYLYIMFKMV